LCSDELVSKLRQEIDDLVLAIEEEKLNHRETKQAVSLTPLTFVTRLISFGKKRSKLKVKFYYILTGLFGVGKNVSR
jgi:hypothetical protein